MLTTIGDKVANLDPSTMCRLLGVNKKGDEVFDSNNWPILDNFPRSSQAVMQNKLIESKTQLKRPYCLS